MPPLDQALARLATELEAARLQGVRVLTLIHGYGSSGAGGVIRGEVRHQLEYERVRGRIRDLVPGEEIRARSPRIRELRRRFPALAGQVDLERPNPGITLVIL